MDILWWLESRSYDENKWGSVGNFNIIGSERGKCNKYEKRSDPGGIVSIFFGISILMNTESSKLCDVVTKIVVSIYLHNSITLN
jgi:hypothetical protein